jgi:hypothetical protein
VTAANVQKWHFRRFAGFCSHCLGVFMRNKLISTAALALAMGLSAPAFAAGEIIVPTSAVINTGAPGFGSINNTFDKSGLTAGYTAGVTNFNTYLAGNPTHTVIFNGFEWFSNSGLSAATVTYDFGTAVGIDALALWNEESSGIGILSLLASLDGITFGSLGTFTPTDNPLSANYGADVFSFAATNARYVRFGMSQCPQNAFPACSIGEVAFRSASVQSSGVPETATWAMMILGMGMIGGAMRRRNVKTSVRFA